MTAMFPPDTRRCVLEAFELELMNFTERVNTGPVGLLSSTAVKNVIKMTFGTKIKCL